MKTKLLAISFFVFSVLALTSSVSAQTSPTVQNFTVTSTSFNPNAYPNAYDVSYSLNNASSASSVTLNADCHAGLTVQKMNDAGGLAPFICGDIGAGGLNGRFAYGAETLTLVFTNSTSQSISEAITLSAYGMNSVTKYVTVPPAPPAPTPQVISFNVTPSVFNPRGYPNAYDASYVFSNASPASGVTVTVGCYQGMTVQTLNDAGGLAPFTCGDIGAGGANGYFAYGGETRSLVFTNSNSQSISVSVTLSAAGMNSVRKYITVSPTSFPPVTLTPTATPTPAPTSQPNPTPLPADIDTQNPQGACLDLQNNLRYRMRDAGTTDDISSFQDYLQANGYLHTEPTGFFGVLTLKAVKDFQQANGISPTGFVGPITRSKIKQLSCR